MDNKIVDKLRNVIRKNLDLTELESILNDSNNIFESFSDVLREEYRKLSPEKLCEKDNSTGRIIDAVLDIHREHIRNALTRNDYFSAWKFDTCKLFVRCQQEVKNEHNFEYLKKLQSLSIFVCHFTDNDEEATFVKNFFEFYNISTFVDHLDASNFSGARWEKKVEEELKERPIFLVLAVDRLPTKQVKKEIELNEQLKDHRRLRINLILEKLSDKSKELNIDSSRQYIEKYEYGEKEAYNYLIKSLKTHQQNR